MENIIDTAVVSQKSRSLGLDILAVLFIYLTPTLSHLTAVPIYYFEPMRIFLIIALLHTSKANAFILAVTLPLFSFAVSAHPSIIKSFLISGELTANVLLFYFFASKITNKLSVVFLSIILSKMLYYAIKYAIISFALLDGSLIATPFYFQLITALVLSFYAFGIDIIKKSKSH